MRALILAALAATVLSASPAVAWNGCGHMIVASYAWKRLSPATKVRVTELLKLNPDYANWIEGVPPAKRGEVAFMRASKWADDIKSRQNYRQGPPTEAGAGGGAGYDDLLQHRYWHFKDLPFSIDGAATEQPHAINAETQIIAFRNIIASGKPDEVKSYALVWLTHLVGDVHQPLHATTRFSKSPEVLRDGDRGGNEIKVRNCATCRETNLHSYWDGLPGRDETPSRVSAVAAGLPVAPSRAAANSDIPSWIETSFAKARTQAYAAPVGSGVGPYTLSSAYQANARALSRKQIALAGARLAILIEDNIN